MARRKGKKKLLDRFWKRVVAFAAAVGVVAGLVTVASGTFAWMKHKWLHLTDMDLPGTYAGESWKRAEEKQYAWLQEEWCYPSLPGFRSRFIIRDGSLFRQNESTDPRTSKSDWVQAEVFISNRGVLRLRYASTDWPGDFIIFDSQKPAEWRENQRSGNDGGSVTSGEQRLVLSCKRCRMSEDG